MQIILIKFAKICYNLIQFVIYVLQNGTKNRLCRCYLRVSATSEKHRHRLRSFLLCLIPTAVSAHYCFENHSSSGIGIQCVIVSPSTPLMIVALSLSMFPVPK